MQDVPGLNPNPVRDEERENKSIGNVEFTLALTPMDRTIQGPKAGIPMASQNSDWSSPTPQKP